MLEQIYIKQTRKIHMFTTFVTLNIKIELQLFLRIQKKTIYKEARKSLTPQYIHRESFYTGHFSYTDNNMSC